MKRGEVWKEMEEGSYTRGKKERNRGNIVGKMTDERKGCGRTETDFQEQERRGRERLNQEDDGERLGRMGSKDQV